MLKIGYGYDSHRLVQGRDLIIGGVRIPFEKGLEGHSDADVLCHAIIDAILGALGKGDIGVHFPDTDPEWKDARSIDLLRKIVQVAADEGYAIQNIDSTVILEKPKLSPFVELMKDSLASTGISRSHISIKAKTNERMGFTGKGEGIAAHAVCLISSDA